MRRLSNGFVSQLVAMSHDVYYFLDSLHYVSKFYGVAVYRRYKDSGGKYVYTTYRNEQLFLHYAYSARKNLDLKLPDPIIFFLF